MEWSALRSFDGTRLAWRVDRPPSVTGALPVVLCNGIACSDHYWRALVPLVAAERAVLRWDYRGHGRSGRPADPEEVRVDSVVADLEALLDHAGVERAVLVGHSYGVQVVLEATACHPDRVAGVAAIAGSPGKPLSWPLALEPERALFPLLAAFQHGAPRLSGALWRALWGTRSVYWGARLLRGTSAETPRHVLEQYFAHVQDLDPGLLLEMFRSMQAHDAEAVLDRIDVPLLVLAGNADGLTPLARMTRVAVRGRGELVVFDGATHTLPAERPAGVAAHLLRFCAEVDGRTRALAGRRGTVGA